jgi:hypothetical protein
MPRSPAKSHFRSRAKSIDIPLLCGAGIFPISEALVSYNCAKRQLRLRRRFRAGWMNLDSLRTIPKEIILEIVPPMYNRAD